MHKLVTLKNLLFSAQECLVLIKVNVKTYLLLFEHTNPILTCLRPQKIKHEPSGSVNVNILIEEYKK